MYGMTREMFIQELSARLEARSVLRPAMTQADVVKDIFLAMLGVGHLLSSRENVIAFLDREMRGLSPDPGEPLFELLSPAWCRLNLRRAMAEGLPSELIADMMLSSENGISFTRQDVYAFCLRLARSGDGRITDLPALERILDDRWLPSHSPAYREAFQPAYRVISADWMPVFPAVREILGKSRDAARLLVTLDGPCASGKTTLAQKLAMVFRGAVLHTDDFVIPHARKTPKQLAIPGGNCDADRLAREVAAPFKCGRPVQYRRYDFRNDILLPQDLLPPVKVLILEGSYCNLPAIREHADVRLFLEAPWPLREARLKKRESPASLRMFHNRWIPLEDAYFAAYHLPDEGCIPLRASDFPDPE